MTCSCQVLKSLSLGPQWAIFLWGGLSTLPSLGNVAGADHSYISVTLERLAVLLQNFLALFPASGSTGPPSPTKALTLLVAPFFLFPLFLC